jgi:hypothetical protein
MDLLITWKHQAKIRPLLQRITADIPKQTIPLTHSMKTEKDSTELYDRLKAIKKEIAAPLQKRTREKQYNITKTNKESTQTVHTLWILKGCAGVVPSLDGKTRVVAWPSQTTYQTISCGLYVGTLLPPPWFTPGMKSRQAVEPSGHSRGFSSLLIPYRH